MQLDAVHSRTARDHSLIIPTERTECEKSDLDGITTGGDGGMTEEINFISSLELCLTKFKAFKGHDQITNGYFEFSLV
ncbi:hypothetical protein Sjap_001577 [Stephania japonica]|uniref:Uncharacterized protein n=1 Tax=Stephania japonica TaxID=461633 RepID=A0AAP0KMI2_9MAGN